MLFGWQVRLCIWVDNPHLGHRLRVASIGLQLCCGFGLGSTAARGYQRGAFATTFFLDCLAVLEMEGVRLEDL